MYFGGLLIMHRNSSRDCGSWERRQARINIPIAHVRRADETIGRFYRDRRTVARRNSESWIEIPRRAP
jgi:hypothetical protein